MNIRIETLIEKLDRSLKSKPSHYLGKGIWCLEVTNKTGYVTKVRIDASTEVEAKRWSTAIVRQIAREGWLSNVTDAVLYESHLFEHFTDYAYDFVGLTVCSSSCK